MNHYILVTSDSYDINDSPITALEIINHRIGTRKWPLYRNTRNRKAFKSNDKILFYIGGNGKLSKHVIGSATVLESRKAAQHELIDSEEFLTEYPDYILNLKKIVFFRNPVDIKIHLKDMEFCPKNLSKWGVIFMGGTRKISQRDYTHILDLSE